MFVSHPSCRWSCANMKAVVLLLTERNGTQLKKNKKTKAGPVEQVVRKPPSTLGAAPSSIAGYELSLGAFHVWARERSVDSRRSRHAFDNRWSLQWRFVTTATVHGPFRLRGCPPVFPGSYSLFPVWLKVRPCVLWTWQCWQQEEALAA